MAEKEVSNIIKLQIEAGKATPDPPVGPALGSSGVNIMQFVKEFNDRTANQPGMIIPVVITVYKDKSFVFITGLDAVLNCEWHRFDELLGKLTYFLTIERSGLSFESLEKKMKPLKNREKILFLSIPGVNISSTDIRFRVEEGKSIRYLVPDEVSDYIYKNKFYTKNKESNSPYFGVR